MLRPFDKGGVMKEVGSPSLQTVVYHTVIVLPNSRAGGGKNYKEDDNGRGSAIVVRSTW